MVDYTLHSGDCLDILPTLDANSIDTVITDPPYGLSFMGKDWDHGIPGPRFWREVLRVAKPGATLLAFGGTRTAHRLVCAIEDAGWEIRDCIMWLYGSGFPKSHDISKGIDKAAGEEREVVGRKIYADGKERKAGENGSMNDGWQRPWREGDHNRLEYITAPATPAAQTWDGWGTALKPAHEPICVAMKPLDGTFANNALTHGVAGLWIDGGRVETGEFGKDREKDYSRRGRPDWRFAGGTTGGGASSPLGRWPANVIHDGSDEVLAGMPETGESRANATSDGREHANNKIYGDGKGWGRRDPHNSHTDTGSAARYFYCAKASAAERTNNGTIDNKHPTVKPLALMRYLCRLTKTPTGGVILDPFMGSGSTGIAARLEGRPFVGIEKDADNYETAQRRIDKAFDDGAQLGLAL